MSSPRPARWVESRRVSAGTILLGLYLAFAPVYWLPFTPTGVLALVKTALLGVALVLIWVPALVRGRVLLPLGIFGPPGFVLLFVAMAPGLFNAEASIALGRTLDLIYGFLTVWTTCLLVTGGGSPYSVLRPAAIVISGLAFVTLVSGVTGVPNLSAPAEFGGMPISSAGFGASRTGWSNGIALYGPIAILVPPMVTRSRLVQILLGAGMIVAIVGSQLIVGGRAGLGASLCAILLMLLLRKAKMAVLAVAVLAMVAVIGLPDYAAEHLRLNRLQGAGTYYERVNAVSAGRLDGYAEALQIAQENPFTGTGFGNYRLTELGRYGSEITEIHNVWLRLLVEAGGALPLTFLVFVVYALWKVWGHLKRVRIDEENSGLPLNLAGLLAVLTIGVMLSLFEPNVLLGAYQNSAMWWVCVGAVVSVPARRSVEHYSMLSHGAHRGWMRYGARPHERQRSPAYHGS